MSSFRSSLKKYLLENFFSGKEIKSPRKIFISTAIDYVNSSPHLGHCLEKVQADVLARYYRSLGREVFFLSGTDENSLKNVKAAEKNSREVKKWVQEHSQKFYALKEALNLSFDDFIRTTQKRHILGTQKLWEACKKDIYKKKYKGLYCIGDESFYKPGELIKGYCPGHPGEKPIFLEETNYFFKLSRYQSQLTALLQKNSIAIFPPTRKNEVLSFVKRGLEDICISRDAKRAHHWGIDVPGDSTQKIWVWFDALSNYVNALGYAENSSQFLTYWQKGETLHIIGKDILRFHAVYWPAILLSAGLKPPRKILVHGFMTIAGQKMSKSIGNVIDPFALVAKYHTDPVRYFLLREIPSMEDGDFTFSKFETRYNSDLAKGLGNLAARILTMGEGLKLEIKTRHLASRLTAEKSIRQEIRKTCENYQKTLENFRFNETLASLWRLVSFCDKYIDVNRPWENKKDKKLIVSNLLISLAVIAFLLEPFLPQTAERIFYKLGISQGGTLKPQKGEPLFPRISLQKH